MSKIGKSHIIYEETQAHLCADISFDKTSFTLWFSVNTSQEDYLSVGLADAFVIAVLPFVLFDREGQGIGLFVRSLYPQDFIIN